MAKISIDIDIEMKRAKEALENLKKEAESAGNETAESLDLDISKMENELQRLENQSSKTVVKIEELNDKLSQMGNIEIEMDLHEANINNPKQALQEISTELANGKTLTQDMMIKQSEYNNEIAQSIIKLDELNDQYHKLGSESKINSDLQTQNILRDKQALQIDTITMKADKLTENIIKSNMAIEELANSTGKIDEGMAKIRIDVDIEMQRAKQALDDLKKEAESAGNETAQSLDLDISKMENELQRLENQFAKTGVKIDELNNKISEKKEINFDLENIQSDLYVVGERYRYLNNLINAGKILTTEQVNEHKKLVQEIDRASTEYARLQSRLEQIGTDDSLTNQLETQNILRDKQALQIDTITMKAQNMSDKINQSATSSVRMSTETKKVDKNLKEASKSSGNLSKEMSKGVKSIVKYGLALFSLRSAYSALSRLSKSFLDSNDKGAQRAKAQLEGIGDVLRGAIAPIVISIVNIVATLFGYIVALVKAFTGIDLASKKISKNTGKVASNTKKARKEADLFTAAFDNADVATSNISDNIDGAGGGMDIGAISIPEPNMSWLKPLISKIKGAFDGILNDKRFKSIISSMITYYSNLGESLVSISLNIVDNIGKVFDGMRPHLERGFNAIFDLYTLMWSDIANASTEWFPIITESINSLVDSIFDTLRPLYINISSLWADIWEMTLSLWETYGKDLVDGFLETVDSVIGVAKDIWELLDAIFSPFLEALFEIWDRYLKDMVMELASFIIELYLAGQQIYNKFIAPLVGFLKDILQPIFSVVFGTLSGLVVGQFGKIINTVTTAISTIRGLLKGIVDFVAGAFTGDWKRAWNGVVNVLKTIMSGVANIMKAPINAMIDLINGFLRGLNRIKIPSWVPAVGGKGFNIPTIPKLARGTYAESGSMQAIIGENGREAVVPLENNTGWIKDFLRLANENGGMGGGNNETFIYLDTQLVGKGVSKNKEREDVMTNGRVNYGLT